MFLYYMTHRIYCTNFLSDDLYQVNAHIYIFDSGGHADRGIRDLDTKRERAHRQMKREYMR